VAIESRAPLDTDRLSPTEIALLAKISDPEQRRRQRDEMLANKERLLGEALGNLAQMRRDMEDA
jgi:hypothetical protein